MRIVHVVEDFSEANTGITSSVRQLSKIASEHGHSVAVLTVGDGLTPSLGGVTVRSVPLKYASVPWRYASKFAEELRGMVTSDSVLHIHGVWKYPQWRALSIAKAVGIPVVLTTHNMLGGWLWRRGIVRRLKKRTYFDLFLRSLLALPRVHALSSVERDALTQGFVPPRNIVVIPNAIDLGSIDAQIQVPPSQSFGESRGYLLFLGRIHPVKALPVLLAAFSIVAPKIPHARLIVAGPGETSGHGDQLRVQVAAAGIGGRIEFVGPVYGKEKWKLICGAWALCAPSYSEGLSMAALEAMAAGVPVITTAASGLEAIEAAGGILVAPEVASVSQALSRALQWSPSERVQRGLLARRIVEEKYCWARVWPQYERLYASMLDVPRPACSRACRTSRDV